MDPAQLSQLVVTTLDDNKAEDIVNIDISHLTSMADKMVLCTATSTRHAKALLDKVVRASREAGIRPIGTEGETSAEWILIDLTDVIVHIMLAEQREFYSLEKLWTVAEEFREKSAN